MGSRSQDPANKRIESLQALRTLAFLGIFLEHADFYVRWPAIGVSVFFVMSGFLMIKAYGEQTFDITAKNNLRFSVNKIRKLYHLHIITMTSAVILAVYDIAYKGTGTVIDLADKIILNATLTQSWVCTTEINFSLNEVAWYLSVTLFLYFMFPLLAGFIKNTGTKVLCAISVLILVIEVLLCIPFVKAETIGISSPVYAWFMYCFPVFRLGDFFIGCVLGKIYKHINTDRIGMAAATICEIIAAAVTVAVHLWAEQEYESVIFQALNNYTTPYIPLAVMWVFLFTVNKGAVTKLFTNRVFIYIGNISSYAYLIHSAVIRFTARAVRYFDAELYGIKKGLLVLAELILSVALSEGYRRMHDKYMKAKKDPLPQ